MKTEINIEKINDKVVKMTFLNVRLNWVWLDKPQKKMDKDEYEYKVTGMISKADYKSVIKPELMKAASKFLGQSSIITSKAGRSAAYAQAFADGAKKALFKDGDKPSGKEKKVQPGCEGMMLFTAKTSAKMVSKDIYEPANALVLINRAKQRVPDEKISDEFYNGMFGNVAVNMAGYTFGGDGLTFYLNGVMKTKDGERLGGSDPFVNVEALEEENEENVSAVPDFGEEEETPKKGKGKKK